MGIVQIFKNTKSYESVKLNSRGDLELLILQTEPIESVDYNLEMVLKWQAMQ